MDAVRSLLNTPAHRPDLIAKLPDFGADGVVLDLEDAVAAERKQEAREIAAAHLPLLAEAGLAVYVRVNGRGTGLLEDDVDAVVRGGLRGIQLPKAVGAEDVAVAAELIGRAEAAHGVPAGSVELFVSIESARAVQDCHAILAASPRVGAVMPGIAEEGDLQGELGYTSTPGEEEILVVRSLVLIAARAVGTVWPLDGVFARHDDLAGFETSAMRARRLGYRGKKLIHPAQVAVANRVFSLTAGERAHYERVLEGFEAALRRGEGTAVVDGRMVDHAMATTARRALGRPPR